MLCRLVLLLCLLAAPAGASSCYGDHCCPRGACVENPLPPPDEGAATLFARLGLAPLDSLKADPRGHLRFTRWEAIGLISCAKGLPPLCATLGPEVLAFDTLPDGSIRLTVADGSTPRLATPTRRRTLTPPEAARFRAALDAVDVCHPPRRKIGVDGTTWRFDFAGSGRTCSATVWSPESLNSPYATLTATAWTLAGLSIRGDWSASLLPADLQHAAVEPGEPIPADYFPPDIPRLAWADSWRRVLAEVGAPPLPALKSDPYGHTRLTHLTGTYTEARRPNAFGIMRPVRLGDTVFTIDAQPDRRLALTVADEQLDPSGPPRVTRRVLTVAEAASFRAAFDAAEICSAGPDPRSEQGRNDTNTEWLFEFAGQGQHCAAERTLPDRASPALAALAATVARLAGR